MQSQSDYIQTNNIPAHMRIRAPRPTEREMTKIITGREAANITILQGKIASANAENGWHDRYHDLVFANDTEGIVDHIGAKIALMHSELSEALEEIRDGRDVHEIYHSDSGKPEGYPIELADTVIRALDHAGMLGIDLGAAIKLKLEYNATRGKMHCGKRL